MQSRNPNRERADTAAFVYAPERQSRSGRAEGLEVVVKVEEAKPEGFFLDFYAIKSTDGGKKVERISLGGTTIFKPLSKGESMTVYLEPPPANAWIHSKRGDQLHLGFEVKAGHGERSVPDVELRIVDVHESSGK